MKQVNSIDNAFQLKSIAYSLAVIADKLSEEGEQDPLLAMIQACSEKQSSNLSPD